MNKNLSQQTKTYGYLTRLLLINSFVLLSVFTSFAQTLSLSKSIQGGQTTSQIKTDGTSTWYYVLNYGVNGANATGAKIIDLLPEGVTYISASASAGIIASTTTTTPDITKQQTQVTVNLNTTATVAGSSGQVLIQVRFSPGYAYNGYIASNTAQFSATGATTVTSNSVSITATSANPAPSLTVTNVGNVVNDIVTYQISYIDILSNTAGGVYLKNGLLKCVLPVGAEFVDGSLRCNTGYTTGFSTDFQYDAATHTVTFDYSTAIFTTSPTGSSNPYGYKLVPKFPSGCDNGFLIRVKYSSSAGFAAGQVVVNNISLTGERVISNTPVSYTTTSSITLAAPVCTGIVADTYSTYNAVVQGDSGIIYNRNINNKNTTYSNIGINYNYGAVGLQPTFVYVVRPASAAESVTVLYNTNLSSTYRTMVNALSSSNSTHEVAVYAKDIGLAVGEVITNLKYVYTNLFPGDSYINYVQVYAPSSIATGTYNIPITQTFDCVGVPTTVNTTTPINITNNTASVNYFVIYPAKSATTSAQIGDVISYSLAGAVSIASATVRDLILADLLPANVTFNAITSSKVGVAGYTSNGTWTGVTSAQTLVNRNIPYTVIDNFNNTGRQLVRWDFSGIPLKYTDTTGYSIVFTAKVNPGAAYPAVVNTSTVLSKNQFIEMGALTSLRYAITDVNDLDGDGNKTETGVATDATTAIAAISALKTTKTVKGSLDATYKTSGSTINGGVTNYKLVVKNTGSVGMKNITLVDVLPYVGDKYLVGQNARGSTWNPTLTAAITAPTGVVVSYSTVADINGNDVGATGGANAPNWTTTLPNPASAVKAVKFEYAHNYPTDSLKAGDSLVIAWQMKVPTGIALNETSWNSFAYTATSTFDGSLLTAEPAKVGVVIKSPQPNIIGNYVWNDINGDGIQNETSAEGLNGVTIQLFKSTDTIVGNADDESAIDTFGYDASSTVTANDANGKPGYYNFINLPNGNFYIKVTKPTGYSYTTLKDAGTNDALDSDINANGMSPMITLTGNNTTINTAYAGFSNKCNINFVATPSGCSFTDFKYTMQGQVIFTDAPTTGTLTVEVTGGGKQTFNAPFVSPINYAITGQTSDGATHTISYAFSADAACVGNTAYTAPANCSCLSPNCGTVNVKKN